MKAREEIRENHKMRHNIWKKYLKIICSWILIFSICGLSLNVTEASGAGVEMERESQETVDFISDIENQETEPEILADDEQLSESEQIVESEKEPENPVEIEDSSDQITDLDAPEQMSVQSLEEELLAVAENGEEASTDRVAYVDVNGNPIAEAPSVIGFGAIADHKELSIEGRHMGKFTNAQIKEIELVENEIIRYLPREHIFSQTNQIVYIHRETEQETGLEFRKKLEKLQQTIQEFLVNKGVEIDFLIGIGKTVTGYHELKESFKSSKIALKYIKVIRRIIGDEDKSVIDSTKIGFFYHVMEKMKNINQLQAFIPESLNELRQYDIQKNGELVDTLECYLNVNQSLKKTSELMFIHYRTASYRLQKIIEITNIDFNNAAEVLSVRNGLIALRALEVM